MFVVVFFYFLLHLLFTEGSLNCCMLRFSRGLHFSKWLPWFKETESTDTKLTRMKTKQTLEPWPSQGRRPNTARAPPKPPHVLLPAKLRDEEHAAGPLAQPTKRAQPRPVALKPAIRCNHSTIHLHYTPPALLYQRHLLTITPIPWLFYTGTGININVIFNHHHHPRGWEWGGEGVKVINLNFVCQISCLSHLLTVRNLTLTF